MRNNWYKKSLIAVIIVLFIGVSITPSIGISNSIDDTTPPVTTISFNPETPNGENDWYVTPVTVTLVATDDMSGVNTTYYSINSEPWEIYDTPFILTEDRLYYIVYFSVDNAGNMEFPKLAHIEIDQTPSFVSLTYKVTGNPYEGWTFYFTATATDHMSGMDRVVFKLNEVEQKTVMGSGPFYNWSYIYGCSKVVKAEAFDQAGNMALCQAMIEIMAPKLLERFVIHFPLLRLILHRIINIMGGDINE